MGIYNNLGVKRIINAFDTYTLLGGHTLADEVIRARDEADREFSWIWDLQMKAGKRVAELTGAEAAFIPVGVFAGLGQCFAALMAGVDPKKMRKLPDTSGMKNEVILQKCLRDFQYDHSIEVVGAKIKEVGDEKLGCTPKQIEDAIDEKTLAIHYMSHGFTGNYASRTAKIVPVEEVIKIGKKNKIPVIVDAAFQCYPLEGFKKFVAMGADAALYSCKYFGGPNTAGLMLGKKYLIEAAAMHSFIGQEGGPNGNQFLSEAERGSMGSLFRGCKQDRGSIVGAVVALERYMKLMQDPQKNVIQSARARADYFMKQFRDIPGIDMKVIDASMPDVDLLKIALQITLKNKTPKETLALRSKLMDGDPSIWVEARDNSLTINITSFRGLMMFDESDAQIVAQSIKTILGS
jgi:L-seryl-tRNA(Ser) seleniumtransferase